jgi:hypothetical protein
VPGLLLLPSKKNRLWPAQYNSQYNSQYSTQIAQKRAISEFSTSGVPPVPWVVAQRGGVVVVGRILLDFHRRIAATATAAKSNRNGATSAILPTLL